MKSGLDAMALFLLDNLLRLSQSSIFCCCIMYYFRLIYSYIFIQLMLQLFLVNAFIKKNENWPLGKSPLYKPHSANFDSNSFQVSKKSGKHVALYKHCFITFIKMINVFFRNLGIYLIFSNSTALLQNLQILSNCNCTKYLTTKFRQQNENRFVSKVAM